MSLLVRRAVNVLAIETSCDNTAAAIVSSSRRVHAQTVVDQYDVHERFGGVNPREAAAAHARHLPRALQTVLRAARMSMADIDVVAVTRGPGLAPCLSVGLNAAKGIAAANGKPLVGVHHMAAHALTARLCFAQLDFPFRCLLVSGGHTLSGVLAAPDSFTQHGTTLDESVGNALDHVAKMLELPWTVNGKLTSPAAALEVVAQRGDARRFPMPSPLAASDTLDFSFSGMRTSTQLKYAALPRPVQTQDVNDIAAAFQDAAFNHVIQQVQRFLAATPQMPLVVSGGVAQNRLLRSKLQSLCDQSRTKLMCVPQSLCSDNAVMIGWAALEKINTGFEGDPLDINYMPKWPLDTSRRSVQPVEQLQ